MLLCFRSNNLGSDVSRIFEICFSYVFAFFLTSSQVRVVLVCDCPEGSPTSAVASPIKKTTSVAKVLKMPHLP